MGIFDETYDPQVIDPPFDFILSRIESRIRALEMENVESESEDLEQGALTDEEAEAWNAEDVMEAIDNDLSNIRV